MIKKIKFNPKPNSYLNIFLVWYGFSMSKVRFGVVIGDFPEDGSRGREYIQKIVNYLDNLDKAYESVWLGDHFTMGRHTSMDADLLECLTALTYLSAKFPNLDFGPLTLASSFRNPALLAKISSTLSVLSGGKFILGIGAGWNEVEYRQYGYDFPSNRTRIKQMEEAVQIIKLLWAQDDVTFIGKYYRVENAYCNPKPDPLPPILIGGGGEKYTLKAAARYADWWNGVFYDVNTWKHKLSVLANHCDDVGRDFDDILKSVFYLVALADSDEEALRLAKRSSFYPRLMVGSPESVASKLGDLVDAGVEYFQLWFTPFPNNEATQKFADEVITELI
jgi:alkanesulfonate monooxygenase SsuD/methylene tetrahydromethanopterin reductase-like flavin-dependent oxidoreductase (luciferase family)